MNNHHSPFGIMGGIYTLLSTILGWIALQDAQVLLSMCASGGAIVVGFFTARYYYVMAKRNKNK
jgi:hypothetical protein